MYFYFNRNGVIQYKLRDMFLKIYLCNIYYLQDFIWSSFISPDIVSNTTTIKVSFSSLSHRNKIRAPNSNLRGLLIDTWTWCDVVRRLHQRGRYRIMWGHLNWQKRLVKVGLLRKTLFQIFTIFPMTGLFSK